MEKIIGELIELHTQQHLPAHSQKVGKELDSTYVCTRLSHHLIWVQTPRMVQWPQGTLSLNVQACMFTLVATSVPSECVFSTTGNVITDKRNRLTSEHAELLIFLFKIRTYRVNAVKLRMHGPHLPTFALAVILRYTLYTYII